MTMATLTLPLTTKLTEDSQDFSREEKQTALSFDFIFIFIF